MFEEYFRFSGSPFRLSPDHRFFFLSNVHKRALAHLRFGLEQAEGFILVTGEVGAGKTTLVEHILSTLNSNRYVTANIVTSNLNQDDLVRMVASAYGLEQEGLNRATVLRNLERFVAESFRRGRRCLLFVDEAQNLAISALEELRMLSNLLVNGKPALQSFLLGQPQFRDTLSKPDLAQLRQRVIASYHLGPLSAEETIEYIEHRLSLVGWSGNPQIDRSAFNAIYQLTDGVPRRINTLCTRTLLYACLEENNKITGAMVRAVAEELETELAQVLTPGTAVDPGPVVTETRDHSASNNAVQEEETQEETDRLHPARRGAVESQAMPSIAPSRPKRAEAVRPLTHAARKPLADAVEEQDDLDLRKNLYHTELSDQTPEVVDLTIRHEEDEPETPVVKLTPEERERLMRRALHTVIDYLGGRHKAG